MIDENIPLINYGKNRGRYGASTLYDNSRSLIYKGGIFAIGLVEGVFNLFSKNSKKS